MYQDYPIYDMKTGLVLAKKPWLLPQDGFGTMLDARLDKGVLEKRAGMTELADTGAGNAIVGIAASMQKGHPTILVCDTKRPYKYNPMAENPQGVVTQGGMAKGRF